MNADHTDRGQEILAFLIEKVAHHPGDLVRITCDKFGITRQAVNRYLQELIEAGKIVASGNTNQRRYELPILRHEVFTLPLAGLEEDVVWRERIAPFTVQLSGHVVELWQYCVSEMVNNAIDHSCGTQLRMRVEQNAAFTQIIVMDDGIGIFRKIKDFCGFEDERHAVLELAKGKLTTDPARHTSEHSACSGQRRTCCRTDG